MERGQVPASPRRQTVVVRRGSSLSSMVVFRPRNRSSPRRSERFRRSHEHRERSCDVGLPVEVRLRAFEEVVTSVGFRSVASTGFPIPTPIPGCCGRHVWDAQQRAAIESVVLENVVQARSRIARKTCCRAKVFHLRWCLSTVTAPETGFRSQLLIGCYAIDDDGVDQVELVVADVEVTAWVRVGGIASVVTKLPTGPLRALAGSVPSTSAS